MAIFKFEPTKTAEWQSLVIEAQLHSGYQFDDKIENYLVLTLDHFTKEKKLISSVIAIDFLHASDSHGKQSIDKLREVGDQCLLLSGLFPERALKKNVSLNYFINIGKQAYETVAENNLILTFDSELFYQLSDDFVAIMDLLHAMRQLPHFNKQ